MHLRNKDVPKVQGCTSGTRFLLFRRCNLAPSETLGPSLVVRRTEKLDPDCSVVSGAPTRSTWLMACAAAGAHASSANSERCDCACPPKLGMRSDCHGGDRSARQSAGTTQRPSPPAAISPSAISPTTQRPYPPAAISLSANTARVAPHEPALGTLEVSDCRQTRNRAQGSTSAPPLPTRGPRHPGLPGAPRPATAAQTAT